MKTTTFTVEGKLSFPTDMLRYDNCFPHSSEDAILLSGCISKPSLEPVRITLRSNSNVRKEGMEITPDRWQSFGWRVIERQTR